MPRSESDIIKSMANLGDSGQDQFAADYTELARITLHERGVSNAFLSSQSAAYILAKVVTDLVEDGELSNMSEAMIATLRVNHPVSEDKADV